MPLQPWEDTLEARDPLPGREARTQACTSLESVLPGRQTVRQQRARTVAGSEPDSGAGRMDPEVANVLTKWRRRRGRRAWIAWMRSVRAENLLRLDLPPDTPGSILPCEHEGPCERACWGLV